MAKPLGIVTASPPPSNVGVPQLASASARQVAQSIGAGATFPIVGKGNYFYFDTLSAPLQVAPLVNGTPGLNNTYAQGTGLSLKPGTFDTLYLTNPNAFPVAYSIRVGFGDFIDNRVIVGGGLQQAIINPTYPTPGSTLTINIPDLSGTAFTDINGVTWLAINRVAILVTNFASATDYLIQALGAVTNSGPAVIGCLARSSLYLPASGSYSISNGGGSTNVTVSEIYNAIPPTFT